MTFRLLKISPFLAFAAITPLCADPLIPGLSGNHPLNEAQVGQALIQELRCAACHDGVSNSPVPTAPDLLVTSSYLNPGYISDFLKNPAKHDGGTTMPSMMDSVPEEKRDEQIAALSAYIQTLAADTELPEITGKVDEGNKLFHEVGCVACHGPKDVDLDPEKIKAYAGLDHVGAKYHTEGLSAFLMDPLSARPSGRMPNMKLTQDEAAHITAYLLDQSETKPSEVKSSKATPEAGKKLFHELRCNSCHNVGDAGQLPQPKAAPARDQMDLNQGCLSPTPKNAPNYHLSDSQRSAIRKALSNTEKATDEDEIKARFTQLNCIACHERDDYGGVSAEINDYFHTTEEALGDAARIPPPLTLAGAKLKPLWMNKVFYDGESVRPYMKTRMPQFGREALDKLTETLGEVDEIEPVEYAPLEKESAPMMRNGAHMLLGNQGLNCIACHNFNGKESPGMRGLDVMTTYQRLQPGWYDAFMRNPAKFRPGIIMPSFWPDGKAIQTEILDGNTDDQLRALWHYFSLGRSARDPSGLIPEDHTLEVEDKTMVYRGRSNEAGFRGIAVGHPDGLNFAFNAQNGALSAIWHGEFVKAMWNGQGAGDFRPLEKVSKLPGDVAFLSEAINPWPLAPVRTKENPVNPDPRYPRQHGYAFKGYSLAEDGTPTLRYESNGVAIKDIAKPKSKAAKILQRSLSFDSDEKKKLYFRMMDGGVKKVDDRTYESGGIRLSIENMPDGAKPIMRDFENGRELILEMDLEPETSELILNYELLQ